MARPELLADPATRRALIERVQAGVPPTVAAQAAGVSARTYQRWMAKGRAAAAKTRRRTKAEDEHLAFYQAVRAAQATGVVRVAATHLRVALGGAIKREVKRVVINEDGAHEEIVEREYYPPHPLAMQWWLERRSRAEYGPVAPRDPLEPDEEEVPRPAAADDDPTEVRADLDRILDRIAAAAGPPPGSAGSDGPPGV